MHHSDQRVSNAAKNKQRNAMEQVAKGHVVTEVGAVGVLVVVVTREVVVMLLLVGTGGGVVVVVLARVVDVVVVAL